MFELFFDIFTIRDNYLTRIDARIKLIIAIEILVLTLTAKYIVFSLTITLLAIIMMLSVRMPTKMILVRLFLPTLFALIILLLQLFMTGATPLFVFSVGGWELTASHEGLERGMKIASRMIAALSIAILLGSVTPATEIFRSLRWLRIPQVWVETAMLTYRYIFVLIDLTGNMITAQKLRFGYTNTTNFVRSAGMVAGNVLIRAIDQSIKTHEAMTLRGYNGTIPLGTFTKLRLWDWGILIFSASVLVSLYLLLHSLKFAIYDLPVY